MPDILVIGARGIPGVEGGAEKNAEMVFPRVVAHGYSVTLLGMPGSIEGPVYKGVLLGTLPGVNFLGTDKIFYQLFALLRAAVARPRLVHLQGLNVCLLLFLYKLLGMKVVVRYGSSDYEYQKWGLVGKWGFRLCEAQLRFADAVIAVSPRYKQRLQQNYALKTVVVIPNGTDDVEVTPEAQAFWDDLALGDAPYVLAVGRVTADKDYDTLVAAVEGLADRNVRLVVAGGPSEAHYADRFFARSGDRIRFIGRIDRRLLSGLYARCAVYVNCSLHEGMSNALLEAISFDRPVLASDIAANRELGLTEACYFPVGDSAALRDKISAAIASPAQFRAGVDFLGWDEVALRVVSLYGDLLRPTRRTAADAANGAPPRGGGLNGSDTRAKDKRVRV
jgi:glycosyltransferase involved in cell wall biosynthesis